MIDRGSVVMVNLDPVQGHEQGGLRPCIVVSPSALVRDQRYPVLIVVPVTGTLNLGDLYPVVQPFPRGLTKPSSVLVDQVRSISKLRIRLEAAALPTADLARVDAALRRAIGL